MNLKKVLDAEFGLKKDQLDDAKATVAKEVGNLAANVLTHRPLLLLHVASGIKHSETHSEAVARSIEDLFQATRSAQEEAQWEKMAKAVLDKAADLLLKTEKANENLAVKRADISAVLLRTSRAFTDPASLRAASFRAFGLRSKAAELAMRVASRLEHGRDTGYYPIRAREHVGIPPHHSSLVVRKNELYFEPQPKQEALVVLPPGETELEVEHRGSSEDSAISHATHGMQQRPAYTVKGPHSILLRRGSEIHFGNRGFKVEHFDSDRLVLLDAVESGRKFVFKRPKEVTIGRKPSANIRLFY